MKTKRKSLRSFILENRGGIDQYINKRLTEHSPTPVRHKVYMKRNDEDRAQWINNDEYLYIWARSEGVNI